ncbi:MAG: hypothetical protein ACFHVJ_10995 [Aestuariibacter sp.]
MSLQGIKNKFKSTTAAAMLASAVMLPFSMASANPQDHGITKAEFDAHCTPQFAEGYHCATRGYTKLMTDQEIIDSGIGKNIVIFHFGKNFQMAGGAALASNRDGVPALAIPGGPDGLMEVFIDGKKLNKQFTHTHMDRGTLVGVDLLYKGYMKKKGVIPPVLDFSTSEVTQATYSQDDNLLASNNTPSQE